MKKSILLYPCLDDEVLGKIRYQSKPWEVSYTDAFGSLSPLSIEQDSTKPSNFLIKSDGAWNKDSDDLIFSKVFDLTMLSALFGPSGIACSNATLGIAISWTSADSRLRGVVPVCTFTKNGSVSGQIASVSFPKALLLGKVDISLIVYISEPGIPALDELHLANEQGMSLGKLDFNSFTIDGKGSVFPVYTVNEPGQPLWFVRCDWEDPTEDKLSECVSVNLNSAHNAFPYLDSSSKDFIKEFQNDVMASAICVIIECLRETSYWDDVMNDINLEEGSVGQAVYYFKEKLGWDMSDPKSTSLSVKKFFDGNI